MTAYGARWRKLRAEAIAAHVAAFGWTCPGWLVPAHATRSLTGDHETPVSRGGLTSRANVSVMCGACNRRKGARLPHPIQLTLEGAIR